MQEKEDNTFNGGSPVPYTPSILKHTSWEGKVIGRGTVNVFPTPG